MFENGTLSDSFFAACAFFIIVKTLVYIWLFLPACLGDAWYHTLARHFAEADTAQPEFAHICMLATALKTTTHGASAKLRLFF
jgi:hypothetical protein